MSGKAHPDFPDPGEHDAAKFSLDLRTAELSVGEVDPSMAPSSVRVYVAARVREARNALVAARRAIETGIVPGGTS